MLDQGAELAIWLAIAFCVSQSAMFSGLNLAMFSLSKLRLDMEARQGNKAAAKVLALRENSNFLLTTILWGNVGINVLLTLLSDSVLAGVGSFFFSTFLITTFGEVVPQAYFSRNALKVAGVLAPVLRVYQILLYPITKPYALVLDKWLGKEGIEYVRERDLRTLIRQHIDAPEAADISKLEGLGAMNFLSIDDLPVVTEGEDVDPASIIRLPWGADGPHFPDISSSVDDTFLKKVEASGKKWVILTDDDDTPRLILDADGFVRHALFRGASADPMQFCHQPIVVGSSSTRLGSVMSRLQFDHMSQRSSVVENDVILLWADKKRVITGADILGRLLQGIARPALP